MRNVLTTTFAVFAILSIHAQKSKSLSTTETHSKESKVENSNGARSLSEASKSNTQVPLTRKTSNHPNVRKEEKIKND